MTKKINRSIKKFNLKSSKGLLKIDPDTIPITIPKAAQAEWMGGDEDPYFKIQAIKYPLKANGDNYLESFFESYISKLKNAPIPGSKSGHEMSYGKRGDTDFILAGALMESKGDGKGTVYFKNYIPKENNETFIKELNSNMIEFSLVSNVVEERIEKKDGSVEWNVIESVYGERNDAVDVGAMDQKLNAQNNIEDIGEKRMDKKEILEGLLVLKTNNGITLPEIAKNLSLETLLITDEQKANLTKHNSIVKLCGEFDPVEFIKGLVEERKENMASVRSAKMTESFGVKVFEDTKKANKARLYAEKVLGDAELTDEKVNEIKEDELYKYHALERSDVDNPENELGVSEEKNKKINANGVKVRKI